MATDQAAIVRELMKRRSQLDPEKGAIVDELAKRMNLTSPSVETQTPKTWADKASNWPIAPMPETLRPVVDFAEGAASGLASTIYQGGDLIRRMTGQERIINKPAVRKAMDPPNSLAGKAGKFAEQGAEFVLPMGIAAKAGKAAGLGLAAKTALEAGTSGAVTAAQTGGDPVATAIGTVAGAAGPILEAKAAPAAKWLSESAAKQYSRVLNATKQGNKWLSKNEVAPGLIERGVKAMTMEGLQTKIGKKLAGVGTAIGDAWDALPAGSKVGLDDITAAMDKNAADAFTIPNAAGQATPKGPLAEAGLKHIEDLKNTLTSFAEADPKTGKMLVPVEKIRSLRQYYDRIAAKAGRYQGQALADESVAEAHGMAADAIRDELAKQYPNIDVLNKEFHFWKDASKVVGDTIMRREGQAKPLGRKLFGAAGGAAGLVTGGVQGLMLGKVAGESLEAALTSPAWNTVNAVWKDRLAKSLATGNRGATEFWIQKIVKGISTETVTGAVARPPQILQPVLAPVQ
jgi:hypothetical protein